MTLKSFSQTFLMILWPLLRGRTSSSRYQKLTGQPWDFSVHARQISALITVNSNHPRGNPTPFYPRLKKSDALHYIEPVHFSGDASAA
jgi:hypothetical protein